MAIAAEILVVDDERDLREMVADYLARHGFGVRAAMDGESMAARLQEKSADLVILDINMLGEDGLTLARRLREHSDVCIMMLTAAGEIVDRVVGLEMAPTITSRSRSICANCSRACAQYCADGQMRMRAAPNPNRRPTRSG